MGGPRLEVFKFGVYIFTPVMFMLYFGAPEFYDKHVRGSKFWPAPETVNTRVGVDRKELQYEVERLRQERLARKAAKEAALQSEKDV